jgi:hypothetical protein
MSSLLILERRVRSATPTCFLRDVSKTALRTTALPEACLPEALGAAAALRPARFVTAWDTRTPRQHGRGREAGRIRRRDYHLRGCATRSLGEMTMPATGQLRGARSRREDRTEDSQRSGGRGEQADVASVAAGDAGGLAGMADFLCVCACRSQLFLASLVASGYQDCGLVSTATSAQSRLNISDRTN